MVDHISSLPDELLCHILSFLPTEAALATRVLSKRWIHLPPLHVLHLVDDSYHEPNRKFLNLVDTVILSHEDRPITTMSLKYNGSLYYLPQLKLEQLIAAAELRHVQDLTILLPSRRYNHWDYSLSASLLTCQTLVVLDLTALSVGKIKPSSVDLPFLKTLRLHYISFNARDDLLKLLSLCPILEDFRASTLSFRDDVNINALQEYTPSLPNTLIRTKIFSTRTKYLPVPMCFFLNVEFLDITKHRFFISDGDAFPTFNNLIHLKIEEISFQGWELAVHVLQQCPKLQSLTLRTGQRRDDWVWDWGYEGRERKDWKYPKSIPECLSSHLRVISLSDFGGWRDDLRFAHYILVNAKVLQVMKICCFDKMDERDEHRVVEALSSIPKMSRACKLSVVTKGNEECSVSLWREHRAPIAVAVFWLSALAIGVITWPIFFCGGSFSLWCVGLR